MIIVDMEVVITGSFKITRSAEESNAENLLIIREKEPAREYLENWERKGGILRDICGGKEIRGLREKLVFGWILR
jgi:phosphatidylserine/phosphatidylglycerophosphate/cardiolipin synthase-like enzyme